MTATAVILVFMSIIILSVRLIMRKNNNKKLLKILTLLWVLCLMIAAILMALVASGTYVAPDKVYSGYWYDATTGEKVRDEYNLVGGKGTHPVAMFFLFIFPFALSGFIIGAAAAFAKEKAEKVQTLSFRIFTFIGYFVFFVGINYFTVGIYPIVKLKRE